MLIFSEKKCLNKNDIIDGWATVISRQEVLCKELIAGSGGGATISHPLGPQGSGHQICVLAVNNQLAVPDQMAVY